MDTKISFTVNGKPQTVVTDPERPLLEVLREDLRLTGTKFGCGEGQCRACTVLLNGESTPVLHHHHRRRGHADMVTIEGLANGDRLHPVQEAFLAEGAFQCGYCTAGMIMGVAGILKQNPHASGIGSARADARAHLPLRQLCQICEGHRTAPWRKPERRTHENEAAAKWNCPDGLRGTAITTSRSSA